MKKILIVIFILITLFIAGCSKQECPVINHADECADEINKSSTCLTGWGKCIDLGNKCVLLVKDYEKYIDTYC